MDITLCTNDKCMYRKNCKRGLPSNRIYQSYSKWTPDSFGHCEGFYPLKNPVLGNIGQSEIGAE